MGPDSGAQFVDPRGVELEPRDYNQHNGLPMAYQGPFPEDPFMGYEPNDHTGAYQGFTVPQVPVVDYNEQNIVPTPGFPPSLSQAEVHAINGYHYESPDVKLEDAPDVKLEDAPDVKLEDVDVKPEVKHEDTGHDQPNGLPGAYQGPFPADPFMGYEINGLPGAYQSFYPQDPASGYEPNGLPQAYESFYPQDPASGYEPNGLPWTGLDHVPNPEQFNGPPNQSFYPQDPASRYEPSPGTWINHLPNPGHFNEFNGLPGHSESPEVEVKIEPPDYFANELFSTQLFISYRPDPDTGYPEMHIRERTFPRCWNL